MSMYPVLWAIDHAPVYDAEERAILVALVVKGDFDGMNCFRSYPTLAAAARVDAKTAGRKCRAMESRGILRRQTKHQSRVWLSIPKEQRPVIWEVMIPAEWWSAAQLESINEQRAGLGRPALTPESRPALAPAPPKKARADKGVKRPKKTAVAPDPGTDSPRVKTDIKEGGVGTTSPYPPDYKSLPPGLQVPQPSESPSESPPENNQAPAARAAGDARRASAGSSASGRESGCAAADGAEAPNRGSRGGTGSKASRVELTPEQAAAVATVTAAWPAELVALLPGYAPRLKEIREAVLAGLAGGRTAEQLAERVRRRWWEHGYAMDAAEGGKGIGSAVGVAVGLVRPPTDCPDPMCEDGARIQFGHRDVCPKCEERRAARRADRRQGLVPGPRGAAGPAPVWWDCEGTTLEGQRCPATGKGTRPADGLCWVCHDRAEAETIERGTASLRAQAIADAEAQRLREAVHWDQMLDEAYEEHVERQWSQAELAERDRQRAAEAEETRRLREQLAREHPELAAYAQQPDPQAAAAPF
ncbi:hypothetical protein ACIA98_41885 [Streptomyces sp. NPDC051366]|uniref:hypothetical protein n=1 Tax=Streptomyces sp. NPDC051366 TaxID=3365652 RepID=UPI0037A9AD1F